MIRYPQRAEIDFVNRLVGIHTNLKAQIGRFINQVSSLCELTY